MKAAATGGNFMSRCLKIRCSCLKAFDLCGSVRFGACFASANSSSAVDSFDCLRIFCVLNCFSPGLERLWSLVCWSCICSFFVVGFRWKRFARFLVFLQSLVVVLVRRIVKVELCMYLLVFSIRCTIGGLRDGCQMLMFDSSCSLVRCAFCVLQLWNSCGRFLCCASSVMLVHSLHFGHCVVV